MKGRFFHTIIEELSSELDIQVEKLCNDWVLQLSKDGKVRHFTGNCNDLNPEAAGHIASDKNATYEVLKSQNIPAVEHHILFNPARRKSFLPEEGNYEVIQKEFRRNGNKLVVKPNDGCKGEGVTLCHTIKEVEIAMQELFATLPSISICPYYSIKTEYRTFYLDGEIVLIYGKTKPTVMGNGKSTLAELVEKGNFSQVEKILKKIDGDYIPKDQEEVEISWKHNLSGGATPVVLKKGELYNQIEKLAIQAGKAMNMRFATIDIIQTQEDQLYVLEVNSGVCTCLFTQSVDGGYEIAKEIYRKALKALFE